MFQTVKGFKKEDLKYAAAEIGEEIPSNITIAGLKDLILNSNDYKKDPEFVQEFLRNVVSERKLQEAEKDKKKEHELELRLEFRQCGDNIKDWLPFWNQFEQIHEEEDIAPEDKFQYLVQATVSGSRAREIVESFPPTGANYQKAILSLQSRFGREDILVEIVISIEIELSSSKNDVAHFENSVVTINEPYAT
ncbi:uncharacterized protein TNCV_951841 [Trichonephila clavipes]|nr:uncharacterized protein TNCV_951841 [Trichonephila clavipes]